MGVLKNRVARQRGDAGLRQLDLASRVGVTRQSLSVLEAGRSVPSAALALRLARELGCKVEQLFWVDDRRAPLSVELAVEDLDVGSVASPGDGRPRVARKKRPGAPPPAGGARVVLASVDGRWVAHRLATDDSSSFQVAADGVVSARVPTASGAARVELLGDARAARDTLLCAGCAPAFGILAARASAARASERVLWIERSSGAALDLLARGQVHVAGAHLYDEEANEFNVPFVQRRWPGRSMLVFNLARWESGLVVGPGNPRRIRGVRDLVRPDVSFVRRQAGAGAQGLIERLLRRDGLPAAAAARGRLTARGHMEVARWVALGVVDAGVSLPGMARAHGLDFIPLAEERFDLVLSRELSTDARVVRLLETLGGRAFRREMEAMGGHATRNAGQLIADTGAPQSPH